MKKYECGHISISRDGRHSHECPGCRPDTSLTESEKDELFEKLREDGLCLRLASDDVIWYGKRISANEYELVNPDNHASDTADMDKVRTAMDVYDDVTLVDEDEIPTEVIF